MVLVRSVLLPYSPLLPPHELVAALRYLLNSCGWSVVHNVMKTLFPCFRMYVDSREDLVIKDGIMDFSPLPTPPPSTEGDWFEALIRLARFLRSPGGCPWDRERGARDFAGFAGEEVTELCEALDSGDNAHAEEEYGDCLFTLLACMAAAEAEGRFNMTASLKRAHEKMVRRHDHVFRTDRAATPEEALASWNSIKLREKKEKEQKKTV